MSAPYPPHAGPASGLYEMLAVMDAIGAHAWRAASSEPTIESRAAVGAAYMQAAATLQAAKMQADALDRLGARLAPCLETLADALGLALD